MDFEYLRAWCGLQACRRRFFPGKKNIPGFFDYVNSGNCQNCQNFNMYGFGDLSKRRAPKNHEFWWYSDLQISHGEPFGEQNDELKSGHQTRIRFSGVATI